MTETIGSKNTIMIRDIEHAIACFSCHEIKSEYAQMHITDPKTKRAFGVLILCMDCSKQLHAGTLRMQPPSTFPASPQAGPDIIFPPDSKKPAKSKIVELPQTFDPATGKKPEPS